MSDISDLEDLVEDVKICDKQSSKDEPSSQKSQEYLGERKKNRARVNFRVNGNLKGTKHFIRPVDGHGEDVDPADITITSRNLDAEQFDYKSAFSSTDRSRKALNYLHFTNYLPVQRVVHPFLSKFLASDFIIKAPAGSGKTFAYLMPIIDEIHRLKQEKHDRTVNKTGPYAVVVAPTRELVVQLFSETKSYLIGYNANVHCAMGFGKQHMRNAFISIDEGCDIIFLTLGRLEHYFSLNELTSSVRLDFENLKYIVLDEAQTFVPNGSKNVPEYNILGRFMDEAISQSPNSTHLQTIFVGAELDQRRVAQCKQLIRHDYISIEIVPKASKSIVCQAIEVKEPEDRLGVLLQYLEGYVAKNEGKPQKVIIFVNTTACSTRICYSLNIHGLNAGALHSDMTQKERQSSMKGLQAGDVQIIVSTDVISAGMNVPNLDCLILYELPPPDGFENVFRQRIGRIGRLGNKGQLVFLFNDREDGKRKPYINKVFESHGSEIPRFFEPDDEL